MHFPSDLSMVCMGNCMTFSDIPAKMPLFSGISKDDMDTLLGCLGVRKARYAAKEAIFIAGDRAEYVGALLSGRVLVVREDFYGNRSILAHIASGQLFAEAFACAGVETLPVSVFAEVESEILLLNFRKLLTVCTNSCGFHNRLIFNLMGIMARKNILLNRKTELLSMRSTRDKLLAYLSAEATNAGRAAFEIPFNRQELADYLAVDRSAMSAELSRLAAEGVLKYRKNQFELL
ncbi:MAG: Crp/Fnr family transcriptional regulator [Oscillospiraceae bacterium]